MSIRVRLHDMTCFSPSIILERATLGCGDNQVNASLLICKVLGRSVIPAYHGAYVIQDVGGALFQAVQIAQQHCRPVCTFFRLMYVSDSRSPNVNL